MKHVRHELARLGKEFQDKGVAVVGISSNDIVSHPDDSPEMMVKEKAEVGYTFPYLYDESQEVAKAYKASCTPDFYVFDKDRKLAYRGQMDSSRPGECDTGLGKRPEVGAGCRSRRPPGERRPAARAWAATSSGNPAMRRITPDSRMSAHVAELLGESRLGGER